MPTVGDRASTGALVDSGEDRGDQPCELSEVIIDTTVESNNVVFSTDARLLNRAREFLVGWPRTTA
jgi:hypothetical protein